MKRLLGAGRLNSTGLVHFACEGSLLRGAYGQFGALKHSKELHLMGISLWKGEPNLLYGLFLILLGECYLEENEVGTAENYIRRGIALGFERREPSLLVPGLLALSRIHCARHETDNAYADIQEIRDWTKRSGNTGYLAYIQAAEIRIMIRTGYRKNVENWVVKNTESLRKDPIELNREFDYLTLIRALMFLGEMKSALTLSERLLPAYELAGRTGALLELHMLNAMVHHVLKDLASAFASLARALTMAQQEGYVRIFVDEGPQLGSLLSEFIKHGEAFNKLENPAVHAIAEKLSAVLSNGIKSEEMPIFHAKPDLTALLTKREHAVMQLIAAGMTNPNIARHLSITTETVKSHCKNIYKKLGVKNRSQAVSKCTLPASLSLGIQGKSLYGGYPSPAPISYNLSYILIMNTFCISREVTA